MKKSLATFALALSIVSVSACSPNNQSGDSPSSDSASSSSTSAEVYKGTKEWYADKKGTKISVKPMSKTPEDLAWAYDFTGHDSKNYSFITMEVDNTKGESPFYLLDIKFIKPDGSTVLYENPRKSLDELDPMDSPNYSPGGNEGSKFSGISDKYNAEMTDVLVGEKKTLTLWAKNKYPEQVKYSVGSTAWDREISDTALVPADQKDKFEEEQKVLGQNN